MANSGESYRICTVDDILKIPDMRTAMEILRRWGLGTKGLKSKDMAVEIIMDHWKKNKSTLQAEAPKKDRNGLYDAIADDVQYRKRLRAFYDQLLEYISSLPNNYRRDLEGVFPNLQKTIDDKKRDVISPDCTVLIAGETGAGKSSFINLILQVDLLPTKQLRCTTTIVELRKSLDGKKTARLYYKLQEGERKPRPPNELLLDSENTIREIQAKMCFEEDGETPYERIEITWPFPGLEDGIVLVDTPGIGEKRQMTKLVERYLTKSFGFIYILNTANAGGVQKGRLRDFLRMVVNAADDDFNPASTMFIGNKWDQVPDRDKAEVENGIFTKLETCYPGLRRDQIYYISVTDSQKAAIYGGMSAPHVEMLQGMERFLPASLRNKLNIHYRFMSQVLKRSLYSVKVAKVMAVQGMEKQKERIELIKRQMEKLEREARYSVGELRKELDDEVDRLYTETANYLRSKQFVDRMFQWAERDCARVNKEWNRTASEASERIASRLASEINIWEKNKKITATIKEKIIKKFKKDFELMENQIQQIEGVLLDGDTRAVTDLHKSMKRQAPVRQIWKKAKAGDDDESNVKGLGGVVSSVGSIGPEKTVKSIFRSYKADSARQKMTDATDKFIQSIFEKDDLKKKLKRFIGKFVKGIDNIAKMIPEFVRADTELINRISSEMDNMEDNLRNVFPQLLRHSSTLQGQIDMFFVHAIMERDFRLRDVEYSKADILGSGSFADVYKAKLKVTRTPMTVALKVSKDPLKENNVTDILLEDRTSRDLKHPNVVRYYGAVLRMDGSGKHSKVYWMMVLEYCTETLKSLFIDGEYANPGKCPVYSEQVEAIEKMSSYFVQICDGVSYFHQKGFVHRDLKLENILIDSKNIVKLTDVGLTKEAKSISGSIVGSPVYMAPEVLNAKGIYDRKADIYSLAIIIWEMWYGVDAAEHIQEQLFGTLEKAVGQGLRPSFSLLHKPPENWERIIKRSWEFTPELRPEASELKEFFAKFLTH
ncbi:tyrosine-protein kinase Fer-like [Mizuhopecten yessoensis]|uniref:Dual specificity protein kinase shkA n=1 Tax=Mizuhopecten yessoensis TaxID=6573 RepID=A0A210Q217_MIZYE|nr:tyrosine-protein kinase Fer-like [Mizuhopecten yessoensis]OWF42780.1 Dual specificity protein kinase shkA [Mizuhopecten yessoensis]